MAGNRTFTCPQCRTQFAWRDSFLNRKVSCKCGCVFEAFEDLPEDDRVDPYDVTADEARRPIAPASTVAKPSARHGSDLPLSPYPTRPVKAEQSQEGLNESTSLKNFILPGVLMAAGIGMVVLHGALDPQPQSTHLRTILLGVIFMILMVVTMLAGGGISAMLMGVEFGSPVKVAYKFAGIAVFAAGVGVLVAGMDPEPMALRGKVMAWSVIIILYWICFHLFFDLDLQENLMSVSIIALLQALMTCVLWKM